jgi:thiamine pyrophosphokinase
MRQRIHIFLNGDFQRPPGFSEGPGDAYVIAADRGVIHPLSLNWPVHVLIGDFDSIPQPGLSEIRKKKSTKILTYPVEKDQTDFELALDLALEEISDNGEILIHAAFGGRRLDMSCSNLLLPAALLPLQKDKKPSFLFEDGERVIHLLIGPASLSLPSKRKNYLFSMIPLSPVASGVSLDGDFKYPLKDGKLRFGFTLGLSNEYHGGSGAVTVGAGILAVFIQPKRKNL